MAKPTATFHSGHRPTYNLAHAVMVYKGDGGGGAFATLHPVERHGKRLRLGAGTPATKDACATLARALGAASTLSGFVPPSLLYLGARSLVWWRPPGPATVYFDTTKAAAGDQASDKSGAARIGKRSGRTLHPGLVFAVASGKWYVYATAGGDRPGPGTRLLRAPYFNVWANGEICTGNVRLPDTLSTAALAQYETAFFGSEFTHPNVHGRERLVRAPADPYAFWRDLLDCGAALGEFPVRQLVDAKLTVQELAQRLEKGSRDD